MKGVEDGEGVEGVEGRYLTGRALRVWPLEMEMKFGRNFINIRKRDENSRRGSRARHLGSLKGTGLHDGRRGRRRGEGLGRTDSA
jgi:hypothetical protein